MYDPTFSPPDQIAKEGVANQAVRICADGGYHVEVTVKGLLKAN
jgi:hypothetical protein